MYLCEWNMLLQEGQDFYGRLKALGKGVRCTIIEEKRHAFDKARIPLVWIPWWWNTTGRLVRCLMRLLEMRIGVEHRYFEAGASGSSAFVSEAWKSIK